MQVHLVSSHLLQQLADIVGPQHLKVGADIDSIDPGWNPHNLDARIMVSPDSTDQIAAIIKACGEHKTPVVTQGGRTGLVGGGISHPGEVILSMGRMARIIHIDAIERVAVVEAGVTLEALQKAAAERGLEPGIDLAARGSATLGGMASTNAGGVMAFRNGVMRHRILGLEAVMPDSSVMTDMTRIIKNAAGYDLKHLLIGAEGTLGIITRLAIRLDPLPQATATAIFGCSSVAVALELVQFGLRVETGHLRAAEALWQPFIELTARANQWSDPSFELSKPVYLLVLVGGNETSALTDELGKLFERLIEIDPDATGMIAQSIRQEQALWRLREDTDAVYRAHRFAPSYDVSIPLSEIEAYVERISSALQENSKPFAPYIFGHIADGNLHIILNCEGPLPVDETAAVEAILYRDIRALGGSFSAEHGVGSKRIHALLSSVDPTKVRFMKAIKATLDPHHLLNPGKVLP